MIVFGFGISLDVDRLPYGVLDGDQTTASRAYADGYRGSYYFTEKAPVMTDYDELDRRLRNGELRFVIEIPSGFERDLRRGVQPTVLAYFDAAIPFRAESARGYVEGAHNKITGGDRCGKDKGLPPIAQPITIEARALYNQSFESVYAMVPGDIMLLIMLIPSMLTALSVVRERSLARSPISTPRPRPAANSCSASKHCPMRRSRCFSSSPWF